MELKGRIVLYVETGSEDCMAAKTKLESLLLPYVEINLTEHPDRHSEMESLSNQQSTVPQIFFNATHIGGLCELEELAGTGRLDEFVEMVKTTAPPPNTPRPPLLLSPDYSDISKLSRLNEIVIKMDNAGLLKNHRILFKVHRSSFQGRTFVSWIKEAERVSDLEAVELGTQLIENGFIIHVSDPEHPFSDSSEYFKLLHRSESNALNAGEVRFYSCVSPLSITADLRKYMFQLHSSHISEDGLRVSYDAIKTDLIFAKYVISAQKLQTVNIATLDENEKMAMFINVYNSLVVHGIIVKGAPSNHFARYKFFKNTSYIIGGHTFSLNEIENGILRGNRRGMTDLSNPFSVKDPRLEFIMRNPDPRIHFALNCASRGCPAIRIYEPDKLEKQLTMATKAFLNSGGVECLPGSRVISLSPIFKWYRTDFGTRDTELLRFITEKLGDSETARHIEELVGANCYKISWQSYDWSLNH